MKNKPVKIEKSFNWKILLYNALFFMSICLWIRGISIYRKTVVEGKVILITALAGMLLFNTLLPFLFRLDYSRFLRFVGHSLIGGSLVYFVLLFGNKSFADKNVLLESFVIREKGSLGKGKSSSCGLPYVKIDFHGTEKQLVFLCNEEAALAAADSVILEYSKGGLGFEVIRSMRLVH